MFERFRRGMSNTRQAFTEKMNVLLDRGPDVDEEFWEGLEEALILSDVGAQAAFDIVESMRTEATRKALPDAYAVMDALAGNIAEKFTMSDGNLLDENPVLVLFVGINGAGKTTTVGKIASEAKMKGREVLLGSADTFRAAAIEQLEEWGRRANVEIVERERGSDPASVCYDTIERAEAKGSDLVLIDTAGRLHTSDDLMRELQKVVKVVRKRSNIPVKTLLVIDATTGQNGLSQAQLFNDALDLDGIIVTKLDGTAKGGIALAVSHQLGLPIVKVGVGESLEDLQEFDPYDFAAALIGAEPHYVDEDGNEVDMAGDDLVEDVELQQGASEGSIEHDADVAEDATVAEASDIPYATLAGQPTGEPEAPEVPVDEVEEPARQAVVEAHEATQHDTETTVQDDVPVLGAQHASFDADVDASYVGAHAAAQAEDASFAAANDDNDKGDDEDAMAGFDVLVTESAGEGDASYSAFDEPVHAMPAVAANADDYTQDAATGHFEASEIDEESVDGQDEVLDESMQSHETEDAYIQGEPVADVPQDEAAALDDADEQPDEPEAGGKAMSRLKRIFKWRGRKGGE